MLKIVVFLFDSNHVIRYFSSVHIQKNKNVEKMKYTASIENRTNN
jgi:hypothetical protein